MKNANSAKSTVTTSIIETPATAPAVVVDPMAAMREMFANMKTEMLSELLASKKGKTPRAPKEEKAAVAKEPKREVWARNPFCVPNSLEAGTVVTVARKGGLYTATVKAWATKHRCALTIAADGSEVTCDRSYVFLTRESAREAITWAKGLTNREITVNPEKDFGTGNGPKNHTGKLVAVFRANDATYEGQSRGFSLGFLDLQDGAITQELIDVGYAEGAIGTTIPHFDAEHGTCSVYYGFGNDDVIDFTVPVNCLFDPRLVTDAFASEYGRQYVAALIESENVVEDPEAPVVEGPAKVEGKVDALTGETVPAATVAANLPENPPAVVETPKVVAKDKGKTKSKK